MKREQKEEEINELLKPRIPIIRKEAKVQVNKAGEGEQFSIKLPISLVDGLNIKKGDIFLIELNPKTKEYSIKLKENGNKNKKTR